MEQTSRPLIAAFWMVGAMLSFTLMAVAGREISKEMNTFELMMYRSIIGFAIVLVLLLISKQGVRQIITHQATLHLKRNVVHFAGQNLWFFGIVMIPLSQLVALEFTNPIWVAILAPLMLGERLTAYRVFAAGIGFIGVLIVAQPGVAPIGWGHAAGLGAAIGFALNTLFTRQLMRNDTVLCVLFWMTLLQAVFGLALSLPGGIPFPSVLVQPWIIIVGLCGLTAHYCLTSALGAAPATIVAPMEFARLPIIAATGALVYGEEIVAAVIIGAAVIFVGNFLNIYGERRNRAPKVSLPANKS